MFETLEREGVDRQSFIQEAESTESKKSFDINASVYMMRHDIRTSGSVLPETHQQVLDEELTYVAEGIDRHSRTKFVLQRDEQSRLVSFRDGKWRSYIGLLQNGLLTAKTEAQQDFRRNFLYDWAIRDIDKGYEMENLRPGQVLSWSSAYAKKEELMYGKDFITDCGLQPEREMGFLYRADCNDDGSIVFESHTVDSSDPVAYAAVDSLLETKPDASLEEQIQAYDDALFTKTGKYHRAGRLVSEQKDDINAYEFVKNNKPYVQFYMNQIENLAASNLYGDDLTFAKRKITYGFWARVKELLNEQQPTGGAAYGYRSNYSYSSTISDQQIAHEIDVAYYRASERNDVLVGCGGSVSGKQLSEMTPDEALDAIFGIGKESANETGSNSKMGSVRCYKCRETVQKKDVVKANSWCCPKCNYEVDVCSGKVLSEGGKKMEKPKMPSSYDILMNVNAKEKAKELQLA